MTVFPPSFTILDSLLPALQILAKGGYKELELILILMFTRDQPNISRLNVILAFNF